MPNSDHRRKVTIEDLLHLKRAERPAPEFWANFEHELRQKQLTALMQKRPWWQEMPQLLARRAYLPLGATAILALTLVTVKYYTPLQVARVENAPAGSAPGLDRQVEARPVRAPALAVSSPLLNHNDQTTQRMDDRTALLAGSLPIAAGTSGQTEVTIAPVSRETPSARTIAANLRNLEQSEPELMNAVLGSRLSPSTRVQTVSVPAEELASLTTSVAKRSRLLANYNDRQLNPEPTAPDSVRERLSRRLGDTDYAERFSRIGLKGDQVSLGVTIKL
jgi:hypothetical protein